MMIIYSMLFLLFWVTPSIMKRIRGSIALTHHCSRYYPQHHPQSPHTCTATYSISPLHLHATRLPPLFFLSFSPSATPPFLLSLYLYLALPHNQSSPFPDVLHHLAYAQHLGCPQHSSGDWQQQHLFHRRGTPPLSSLTAAKTPNKTHTHLRAMMREINSPVHDWSRNNLDHITIK